MSNKDVINFGAYKKQDQDEAGFLRLIDKDIEAHPADVKPIPSELMKRMSALISRAEANNHADLLEG